MPRIAGIATKRNTKGQITHVTINIEKHKELITPMLNELGIIDKTAFQKKSESAISLEEFRKNVHKKANNLWKK